jgi:hypothetical protein
MGDQVLRTEAAVELLANIDADDIVKGLNNNDELILAFIIEVLFEADSSELRARVVERVTAWDEEFPSAD